MATLEVKMKLLHKLQEKLADRFSFVQYPNIRPADKITRQASRGTGSHFVHSMSIGKRLDLVLLSMGLLAAGVAGLAVVGFLGYVVLSVLLK
jgi:hypothetical protein